MDWFFTNSGIDLLENVKKLKERIVAATI